MNELPQSSDSDGGEVENDVITEYAAKPLIEELNLD